jgi:hypothetical protein
MESSKKYDLIITKDDEKFTPSECTCTFCTETSKLNLEWNTLVPTTNLQKRMKTVIERIETRASAKENEN